MREGGGAERRGRRRWWRTIAIAFSILALLASSLELGLRIWSQRTHRERGSVFDPELGWRMVPSVVKVGKWWSADEPARTNALGWRDAEFALERRPGVRRVIALGDSFTFGVAVDYGERFTEELERLVPDLEVLNFGVNAFGPDQELRLLETEGLRYRPDVVLLTVFLGNDLDDIRYARRHGWPRPRYELAGGELRFHPAVATWDVRLRCSSYLGEALFRVIGDPLPPEIFAPGLESADTLPLFEALVARMAELTTAAGARLVVALAYPPERLAGEPSPREREVRGLLEAREIELVDTFELLSHSAAAGEEPHAADGHWSARGHALVAGALAPSVR